MDAAQLRQAYEVLLAEAETGGFGPPPPGEWTAEQVVAHVAANDELLIEATEAVIAYGPRRASERGSCRDASIVWRGCEPDWRPSIPTPLLRSHATARAG